MFDSVREGKKERKKEREREREREEGREGENFASVYQQTSLHPTYLGLGYLDDQIYPVEVMHLSLCGWITIYQTNQVPI